MDPSEPPVVDPDQGPRTLGLRGCWTSWDFLGLQTPEGPWLWHLGTQAMTLPGHDPEPGRPGPALTAGYGEAADDLTRTPGTCCSSRWGDGFSDQNISFGVVSLWHAWSSLGPPDSG